MKSAKGSRKTVVPKPPAVTAAQFVHDYLAANPSAVTCEFLEEHRENLVRTRVANNFKFRKEDMCDYFHGLVRSARLGLVRVAASRPQQSSPGSVGVIVAAESCKADDIDRVLRHWVWCVRRKALDLPIGEHVMPIFTGAQGGGKSVFVRKFTHAVFPAFAIGDVSLGQIEDDRASKGLGSYLIQVFDEMKNVRKVEVASLKRWISASGVDFRPMGTNEMVKARQRGMPIGTSNPDLSDLIHDDTGLRRFYEIRCKEKLDWNAVNGFDFAAYWDSVDIHAASPSANVREKRSTSEISVGA